MNADSALIDKLANLYHRQTLTRLANRMLENGPNLKKSFDLTMKSLASDVKRDPAIKDVIQEYFRWNEKQTRQWLAMFEED